MWESLGENGKGKIKKDGAEQVGRVGEWKACGLESFSCFAFDCECGGFIVANS